MLYVERHGLRDTADLSRRRRTTRAEPARGRGAWPPPRRARRPRFPGASSSSASRVRRGAVVARGHRRRRTATSARLAPKSRSRRGPASAGEACGFSSRATRIARESGSGHAPGRRRQVRVEEIQPRVSRRRVEGCRPASAGPVGDCATASVQKGRCRGSSYQVFEACDRLPRPPLARHASPARARQLPMPSFGSMGPP